MGRPVLSLPQIYSIKVAIPSVEEQKLIFEVASQKLSSIEHLEAEINTQLLKAEKNKQSILATAFSGKLIHHKDESV